MESPPAFTQIPGTSASVPSAALRSSVAEIIAS